MPILYLAVSCLVIIILRLLVGLVCVRVGDSPENLILRKRENFSVVAVTLACAVEALPVLSVYFVTVLRLERRSDGTTFSNAGQIVFFMYEPFQPPALVFVVFMRKAAEEPVEL